MDEEQAAISAYARIFLLLLQGKGQKHISELPS
jgi:hypothetical protein